MVIQCCSCESVFENSIHRCTKCGSGNIVVGYIDDKIIPIIARVKREDGNVSACVIYMPESFMERDDFDDTYDEMLWEAIEEKIYFEGQGYELLNTEKIL